MLKTTFELLIESLYAFYSLAAPDDTTMDAMYEMLGRFPEPALEQACKEYRENCPRMARGDNVALALKRYAASWRDPARTGVPGAGPCPDACLSGLFYVRRHSRAGPYVVMPCVRCAPNMANATTRSALLADGYDILDRREIVNSHFS